MTFNLTVLTFVSHHFDFLSHNYDLPGLSFIYLFILLLTEMGFHTNLCFRGGHIFFRHLCSCHVQPVFHGPCYFFFYHVPSLCIWINIIWLYWGHQYSQMRASNWGLRLRFSSNELLSLILGPFGRRAVLQQPSYVQGEPAPKEARAELFLESLALFYQVDL